MKILSKKGFIYSYLVLTMLVWNSGFSGLVFSTVKAEEELLGADPKVTICHKPAGEAEQTMDVPESALAGHLGHGDTLGVCVEAGPTKIMPCPDFNDDGKVNLSDFAVFGKMYGEKGTYNQEGDFDQNGKIDEFDKLVFETYYNDKLFTGCSTFPNLEGLCPDYNGDYKVNLSDLPYFTAGNLKTDLNGNGIRIDEEDAAIFSVYYNSNYICPKAEERPTTSFQETPVPACGNAVKEGSEQCDDGDQVDGDGCSANCTLETTYSSCTSITDHNGWYGEYYNYSRNHQDMAGNSYPWPDNTHGDPLGSWTADWYQDQYFKFNRVDSSLNFGDNFFPFDMAKEEEDNGHDYHFGAHWRAQITVPSSDNYNFVLTSDDDSWVYLDGQLVANNGGIHAAATIDDHMLITEGSHIVDVFFTERHVTGSYMSFAFSSPSVQINPMPEECEEPTETYPDPFCSVLYGLMQKDYNKANTNLEVLDLVIDKTENINLSDFAKLGVWYSSGDDKSCYAQIDNNLSCTNWKEYDWCNGLLQGVRDSYNSQSGDSEYHTYFDLNNAGLGDGKIDMQDEAVVAGWISTNAQETCYNRLVPPLMSLDSCQQPAPYCGDGIVNDSEQCDYNSTPIACETDGGYAGMQNCDMPDVKTTIALTASYCTWDTCNTTQSCGDGVINGHEACDGSAGVTTGYHCDECQLVPNQTPPAPAPTSGGGGGGGFMAPGPYSITSGPQCVLASISWVTSQASISWLVYGISSNTYPSEYKDTVKKVGHTLVLTNLSPSTTYYYRVKMQNTDGSVVTSDEKSFTTKTDCPIVPQVLGEKVSACQFTRPDGLTTEDNDIIKVFNFANGTLIRGICDPRWDVYLIKDQKKWRIPSWNYLWQHHFGQRIFNVPQSVIASYPSVK
jgi:fibro-slime domain-containing protein